MSLFWRSWLTVSVLIVIVLGVLCVLAALQFSRIESNLIRSRLTVLATNVQAPFQSAARLGLPLASVRNGPAILQRSRLTDPQIAAIHVFEPSGRIVHSSEANVPTSVRSEVLFAVSDAHEMTWSAEVNEFIYMGMQIAGPTGASAGGVVIIYPKIDLLTSIWAMVAKLLSFAAGVLALMSVLALALLRFGLRQPIKLFAALEGVLDGFERDGWRRLAGSSFSATASEKGLGFDTEEVAGLVHAAEEGYRRGGDALTALETQPGAQDGGE